MTVPAVAQNNKIDSLKKALETAPPDSLAVITSIALVEALWNANQDKEALDKAQAAYQLSQEIHFIHGVGLASLHMGIIYYRLSDFRKGVDVLNEATALLKQSGTIAEQALAFHWSGNICYRIGQYEKALDDYLSALRLREEINDQRGIAFTLFNIANIHLAQNHYDKALAYHFRSLAIKEKLQDQRAIAYSYNNIANVYGEQGQLDQALINYTKAEGIFQAIGNTQGLAYAKGNRGRIYKRKKDYSKALEVLQEAMDLIEKSGDKQALVEANNELASVYLFTKQFEKAEGYLKMAQRIAQETGVEDKLIDNYLTYAQLDSARGNMAGAFAWHKKFMAKKESIFDARKSDQINELQTSFDLERKDREIEFLNKEKELQASIGKNRQYVLTAIIVALVVLAGGLFYFLYQKQKTNRLLEEQKKFAENLNQFKDKLFSIISHDLRGPLSSLKGVLELATAQHLTEAELVSLLRTLGENTGHVTDLIDNLLHWARGHLSGESLEAETNDLHILVDTTIDLLKPLADKKQISMTNRLATSFHVLCDRTMIEIVLRNLISNAIKFTPASGVISIFGEVSRSTAIIFVEDTGIGMTTEQTDRLFGHQSITTRGTANEKGTGFGLILCREFVEKNGGTIGLKTYANKGSTFYFTLPLPSLSTNPLSPT